MRKGKADLVRGWLEKARRDFNTAVNSLNAVELFTDIVCFHAQQAAEKYLKAYLIWQEIEFPRTHALEDLVLLAAQKEPDFLDLRDEVASLTPYAVEARYPEFGGQCLKMPQKLLGLRRKWHILSCKDCLKRPEKLSAESASWNNGRCKLTPEGGGVWLMSKSSCFVSGRVYAFSEPSKNLAKALLDLTKDGVATVYDLHSGLGCGSVPKSPRAGWRWWR